jgi:hypothetical protein
MDMKLIEVKFEYQNKLVTIKDEQYKTIKEIKEKAIKIFHKIPKDIHCFYLSRDLESYENDIIGELFVNREKVTLKLMPKKKQAHSTKHKSAEKTEDKFFSDIFLNTKVYSSGFNNIGMFRKKKTKGINSNGIKNRNKEKLMLPPINTIDKNVNILNDNNFLLNLGNIEDNDDDDKICQNCSDNKFSEYCRNCKEFLCNNCKNNEKHQNHLFIHLNSSYESNIKIYGNILLTDIEFFKANNNVINENESIINNCNSLLNINELNQKHKALINKLKDIINTYESILDEIKNALILEGENKVKEALNTYNNDSMKINDEINQLLKQLEKNKEKMNINEFKNFFKIMSEKEEKLNEINKNIIHFHLITQINNKISLMINKIDKALNETYNDDKNNPFNLPPKFNEELSIILNNKIKNDQFIKKMAKRSKTVKIE